MDNLQLRLFTNRSNVSSHETVVRATMPITSLARVPKRKESLQFVFSYKQMMITHGIQTNSSILTDAAKNRNAKFAGRKECVANIAAKDVAGECIIFQL
jgi:hypothetical protein